MVLTSSRVGEETNRRLLVQFNGIVARDTYDIIDDLHVPADMFSTLRFAHENAKLTYLGSKFSMSGTGHFSSAS